MGRDLTEMNKLEDYLKANGFVYKREDKDVGPMDVHQIIVFEDGVRSWDAICHCGSYGVEEGLLEIMGDIVNEKRVGDSVEGWLTAEDVIERIEAMK